jgi:uncharacterized membrane protein
MTVYEWILVAVLAALAAFMLLSYFLFRNGRIRRNSLFGLRTPAIMESEETWSYVHRVSARYFLVEGIVMMITAMAWLITGMTHMPHLQAALFLVGFIVFFAIWIRLLVTSHQAASKYNKQRNNPQRDTHND